MKTLMMNGFELTNDFNKFATWFDTALQESKIAVIQSCIPFELLGQPGHVQAVLDRKLVQLMRCIAFSTPNMDTYYYDPQVYQSGSRLELIDNDFRRSTEISNTGLLGIIAPQYAISKVKIGNTSVLTLQPGDCLVVAGKELEFDSNKRYQARNFPLPMHPGKLDYTPRHYLYWGTSKSQTPLKNLYAATKVA